jgi:hypothetical protein
MSWRRQPHKLVFRSKDTGKKLFVARYTDSEFSQIETAAKSVNMTIQELIISALQNVKNLE